MSGMPPNGAVLAGFVYIIDEGNNTGIDSYPPCTNSVLLVIFKLNAYFYNVALVICDISFAVF